MPYRRLPNTDKARLRTLRQALMRAEESDFADQFIPYRMLGQARQLLQQFETLVNQYSDTCDAKITANRNYRHIVQNAHMYISHFIQVLNLSVIRGEIKRDAKEYYQLDPTKDTIPELLTEEDLLFWGKAIIEGEQKRINAGGFPLYNPTINKVKVHYDIFREHQMNHALHKQSASRVMENVDNMRGEADALILEMWNLIENHYKDLLPFDKMQHCKAYGMIYYYRPGEKHLSADTDQQLHLMQNAQTTLQWSE